MQVVFSGLENPINILNEMQCTISWILSYVIYFKAGFNKKMWTFAWSEEQIEPRFISMNITVQTTFKMNTGYLF